MLDHVGFSVSDLKRAKEFYCQALAPLGYTAIMEFEGAVGMGRTTSRISGFPLVVLPIPRFILHFSRKPVQK